MSDVASFTGALTSTVISNSSTSSIIDVEQFYAEEQKKQANHNY